MRSPFRSATMATRWFEPSMDGHSHQPSGQTAAAACARFTSPPSSMSSSSSSQSSSLSSLSTSRPHPLLAFQWGERAFVQNTMQKCIYMRILCRCARLVDYFSNSIVWAICEIYAWIDPPCMYSIRMTRFQRFGGWCVCVCRSSQHVGIDIIATYSIICSDSWISRLTFD